LSAPIPADRDDAVRALGYTTVWGTSLWRHEPCRHVFGHETHSTPDDLGPLRRHARWCWLSRLFG
jgi:hypothetical protein